MTLQARILSAVRWTATAKLLGQLLTWAVTLLVIRILTPADYGLMAMAMVFVSVLTVVAQFGFATAIIQAAEIGREQLSKLYGVIIVAHVAACVLLVLGAPLVAWLFQAADLVPLVQFLAIEFLLWAAGSVPSALLHRELQFKALATVEVLGAVAGSLVTLALALHGAGVWALLVGSVAKAAVWAVAINVVVPTRIKPTFSFSGIGGFVSFGGMATLNTLIYQLTSQIDVLIGGRILGKEGLGFYSVALTLSSLPLTKLSSIIRPVALPAYSRLRDEGASLREAVRRAIRLLSIVAFPVFLGISSVAPEIVGAILGNKWRAAEVPLILLPLAMPLRLVGFAIIPAVIAAGRIDINLRNNATLLVSMAIAFGAGSQWGVIGLSLAWVLVYPVMVALNFRRSLAVLSLSIRDLVDAATRPALAAVIMYFAVAGARLSVPAHWPAVVQLVALVAVGVVTYATATVIFNREGIAELRRAAASSDA